MLTVERLTNEQFEDMAQEWEDLLAATADASFFQTWHWNLAWWKSFNENRSMFLLAFRYERELVGLVPLYQEKKLHWTGLTFTILRFMGTEKVSSDHLGFLHRTGFERAIVHEFVHFLGLHRKEWDIVELSDFSDDSVFIGMIQAETKGRGFALLVDRAEICPYLTLPKYTATFYEKLSTNMRYNIRRRVRQLQNLGFSMKVEDGNSFAFREMVRLHNSRWHMESLPGNFRDQRVQKFHTELLSLKARDWKPLFFFLSDGQKDIASLYAFLYCGKLIYYQAGFDPAYAKFSPGLALMALVIEYAVNQKLQEFDLLRGNEAYKWKWTKQYRRTVSYSIFQRKIRCGTRIVLDYSLKEIKRLVHNKSTTIPRLDFSHP